MPVSKVKTLSSSKSDVDRQTDRQTDYCNPRACALRVKYQAHNQLINPI